MSCLSDALRYLGVRGEADTETLGEIERHLEWLKNNAAAKHVAAAFPLSVLPESRDLAAYFRGYDSAYLFAATLGTAVDARMRALQAASVTSAVIFDACASAYAEEYCDKAVGTDRFAPGYGDVPLSWQKTLCGLLQTQKRIGLTVTPDFTLLPMKSMTAFMRRIF
ncbi:hypothetical protein FACS18949_00160 [Clostridia bacterium]|nr:hypothetical protein FACS18949_00160 [Clostridia bacterium]